MGKLIIQQRRGKGSPTYRAHGFRHTGIAKLKNAVSSYKITDIVSCRGHAAPLATVVYNDDTKGFLIASEGQAVGNIHKIGKNAELEIGSIKTLEEIPEETPIYNIEGIPGDGGKFVRSSGMTARIVSKSSKGIMVLMPSKKQKKFHPQCRAEIGVVAGGGRPEKPFLKAGKKFYAMKAKNKLWPIVSGSAMNAVDHPFGNARTSRKSKAKPAPANAPPGRKVGMLRPKQTGRKRGKR